MKTTSMKFFENGGRALHDILLPAVGVVKVSMGGGLVGPLQPKAMVAWQAASVLALAIITGILAPVHMLFLTHTFCS